MERNQLPMKGYEGIADALIREGVDTVFGLMAIDNMPFMTHLQSLGIKVVRARTEHGAICMADGYARTTGKLGVVSVGDGPGAGMTATALLTAQKRRSPVLLICGDTPAVERHNIKHFDQAKFFEPLVGKVVSVRSMSSLSEDLLAAFQHVRSGEGPAVLNCPINFLEDEIENVWSYEPSPIPARIHPDPTVVAQALAVLTQAERPLILAGRGAVEAEAADSALECAELLGAVVGTTMQAEGLFRDDPYCVGVVGGLSSPTTKAILKKVDVILAVGAGLNTFTTEFGRLFPNARIVHIDNRPTAINGVTRADVAMVADAHVTLMALNESLRAERGGTPLGLRTADVKSQLAEDVGPRSDEYLRGDGVIDPREFLDILDRELPAARTLVTDTGHAMFFVVDHISPDEPSDRVWGADFAAMSVGIPLGIGACIGQPDKHTVVFVGDGAFMMSMPELDTAVREGLPLTIVVLNDEAYGAEVHYLENWGLPKQIALFDTPDLAAVANSLRCDAMVVRSPEDARVAVSRIGQSDKTFVIDVRTDVRVMHRLWVGSKRLSGGE